jgi:hypothetical protein
VCVCMCLSSPTFFSSVPLSSFFNEYIIMCVCVCVFLQCNTYYILSTYTKHLLQQAKDSEDFIMER